MKKPFLFSILFVLLASFGVPFIVFAQDGLTGGITQPPTDTTTGAPSSPARAPAGLPPTTAPSSDVTPATNTTAPAANTANPAPAANAAAPASSASTGFIPLAPIPGLTQGVTADQTGLANFLNNLYKFLIGLAAAIAVVEIIWGGLEISTQDSVSKHKDGKERIYNAIFGLVLVLSPALVFSIINPSILNLSINLPPLDTRSGAPAGMVNGSPQTPAAVTDTATGCTVTGTLLKKASCPTPQAAQNFAASATCTANGSGSILPCQGGVNSSGCVDTRYYVTCDTSSGSITGPYIFLDVSPRGSLSTLLGHDTYEPLASTPNDTNDGIPANPNNGSAVMQFASTCNADGGVVCMSTIKHTILRDYCTYNSVQPPNQQNTCSYMNIYCTNNPPSSSFLGGCDQPFRVIN